MGKGLAERVAALEAFVIGKGGVIEKLEHLDACVDSLKRSVWQAAGGLAVVVVLAQWLLK